MEASQACLQCWLTHPWLRIHARRANARGGVTNAAQTLPLYVCMYVCVCAYVLVYVCVYVCICVYIHVCTYVCAYGWVCVYVQSWTWAMDVDGYVHTHARTIIPT